MLTEPWLTQFRRKTEGFEGRISWMYSDTRGNVTCAIGHMLPTPESAELLPFSGGMGAVSGLVVRDWRIVKAAQPGRLASFYEALTESRLSDEVIDSIFAEDCQIAWNGILTFLSTLDALPPPVQCAVLDMAFNLGVGKLRTDYFGPHSKFGPAILHGDWQKAAAESARNGIPQSRNDYTRDLIMSANTLVVS